MSKKHKEFPVPKLSSMLMRSMKKGDTVIVAAGPRVRTNKNLFQAQVNVTSRANYIGGEFFSKVADLVIDHEGHPVVIIYCSKPADPLKKRGRPFGQKNKPKPENSECQNASTKLSVTVKTETTEQSVPE